MGDKPPAVVVSDPMASAGIPRPPRMPLPPQLYSPLHPGRRGSGDMSTEEIAAIQRERLCGAMLAGISKRGYRDLTVDDLCRLARMSKRDLYRHFGGGLHDCFLDLFDRVSEVALHRLREASRDAGEDREEVLRALVGELVQAACDEPAAARVLLLEPFAVGGEALRRLHAHNERVERLLSEAILPMRNGEPPPLLAKAMLAGISSAARIMLIMGTEEELPAHTGELADWACCCACAPRAAPARLGAARPPQLPSELPSSKGETEEERQRQRVLIATVRHASQHGWTTLCEREIREAAQVSCRQFHNFFGGKWGAFLAAVEFLWARAITHASTIGAYAERWPEGVHRGVGALMACLIADSDFARLAFVELMAGGLDGVCGRELLVGGAARTLRGSVPSRSQRPGALAAHASVAAAWAVVHRRVLGREIERVDADIPMLSFIALAPTVGVERAAEAVGASRDARAGAPQRERM